MKKCPNSCKHLIDGCCTVGAGSHKPLCPYDDKDLVAKIAAGGTYKRAVLLGTFGRKMLDKLGEGKAWQQLLAQFG